MIPASWIPHRRTDREVVGYLRESGDGFQPMDLFGRPLAEPSDWLAAEELLDAHSLAWVAEPFLLDVDGADVRVRVTEVSPEHVRVKLDDFGAVHPGQSQRWQVPLPDPGRLRPAPPLEEWPS